MPAITPGIIQAAEAGQRRAGFGGRFSITGLAQQAVGLVMDRVIEVLASLFYAGSAVHVETLDVGKVGIESRSGVIALIQIP